MDTEPIVVHEKKKSTLEKVPFIIFIITLLLLPFVFIPNSYAPFEITKTTIVAFGVLFSGLALAITHFKRATLKLPKHPLILAMGVLLLSIVVSGFGSTSIWKSFIGQGFEMGTVSFLALMFVVAGLSAYFVSEKRDRLIQVYTAILAAFSILAIFHIARLITDPGFLSFGILNSMTSSLAGSWFDLGIFAGIVALISFFGIKYFPVGKGLKSLLVLFLILSGFFLFIINFRFAWIALAIIFLSSAIYEFIQSQAPKTFQRISIFSVILLLISLVCIWQAVPISSLLQKTFGIQPNEINLSWRTTLDVATNSIKDSPVLGAGPNRFGVEYLRFKPLGVNATAFWNTEFSNGSGFIPGTLVTGGILGFLLWILFLAVFVRSGLKALRNSVEPKMKFMTASSFFIGSFLWIMNIFYVPSHTVFFYTFVFTGLFIASLSLLGLLSMKEFGTEGSGRTRSFVKIVGIATLVLCILWIGLYGKKTIALSYFKSGIKALKLPESEGIPAAEKAFQKALMWDESDVYYQALSEVTILKITALARDVQTQSETGSKTPDPEKIKAIPDLIALAIDSTKKAVAIDPTNYYNYVSEARISEVATSLNIPNGYENSKTAYTNALMYNPANPGLYLSLARLEASQNKPEEALKNIGRALELKQNYIDAIFFLSQLQVSAGKTEDAITSVLVATQINPENPLLFFQLGLLYYNEKNYQLAGTSFSKAVELAPLYANARYFLGLTLARLGRNPEAIAQFETILETNPESQEVVLIISNLKAGKSPFTDAKPPVDNAPEKRGTLPVKDSATTGTKSKKTP